MPLAWTLGDGNGEPGRSTGRGKSCAHGVMPFFDSMEDGRGGGGGDHSGCKSVRKCRLVLPGVRCGLGFGNRRVIVLNVLRHWGNVGESWSVGWMRFIPHPVMTSLVGCSSVLEASVLLGGLWLHRRTWSSRTLLISSKSTQRHPAHSGNTCCIKVPTCDEWSRRHSMCPKP